MRATAMAAYRPDAPSQPLSVGSSSRGRRVLCGYLLAVSLGALLIVPGASALAAETTTGYNQTPPAPKTETTKTTTTPATKSTTTTTPAKHEVAPTQTSTTPAATQEARPTTTATTTTPRAATLPFTGLDLRWVIVAGMFLLGAGLSIVVVQRRRGSVS